jgi:peptide/nickel transport system permease protein
VNYVISRSVQSFATILIVSMLAFLAVRATGDVVKIMAPIDATDEQMESMRGDLGLDQPVPVQFLKFASHAVRGDFGNSFRSREPALDVVRSRIAATAQLTAVAFAFACLVGIPIGVFSASRRGGVFDHSGRVIALLGQSVPQFWAGIVLILVFSVQLGWLPSGGRQGLDSVILPAIALGWYSAASLMRITRSATIDALNQDYIAFGRARGLSSARLVWRHGFRNALVPVITLMGVQLGHLLSGAVAVETVFAWPGLGKLMIDSIFARDYAVVQAGVVVAGCVFVIVNLTVDISYAFLDPRIRTS